MSQKHSLQPQAIDYPAPVLPLSLDENHTHFILVDAGKVGSFGGEIELRAAIERALTDAYKCPIVLIVIEGLHAFINNTCLSLTETQCE